MRVLFQAWPVDGSNAPGATVTSRRRTWRTVLETSSSFTTTCGAVLCASAGVGPLPLGQNQAN